MYRREDNMGRGGCTEVGADRPENGRLSRVTSIFMPNLKWSLWNTVVYNLRSAVRISHPTSWLHRWSFWLVFFTKCRIRILIGTTAILTEAFRSFPHPFPCKYRDGTSIRQRPLRFQSFPVHPVFCILTSWSGSLRSRRVTYIRNDIWVESRLGHRPCWPRHFVVFLDTFRKIPGKYSIRPRPLPSRFFPVRYSLIIQWFCVVRSGPLAASLRMP
jgi:hypothetical protein